MTLEEVRNEIDEIDTNMKPLFLRRMKCGKHVAEVKGQNGGDVFVLERVDGSRVAAVRNAGSATSG